MKYVLSLEARKTFICSAILYGSESWIPREKYWGGFEAVEMRIRLYKCNKDILDHTEVKFEDYRWDNW